MNTRYLYLAMAYVIALAAAWLTGFLLQPMHPLWIIAGADLVGTLVIFAFSVAFNNSSFYDPYWSLGPIAIAIFLAWTSDSDIDSLRNVAVLSVVIFWGLRLTFNFLRGWPDIKHEDWRYVDFRTQMGKWYWLVSFSALHLFPTIMVFMGCLPLYPALFEPAQAWGWLDLVAICITGGAILIETLADEQLRTFVKGRREARQTLDTGLWAWSRHPNYFGEMGFWWGLFLFGYAANPAYWWTIIGPVSITLMFWGASIPLIEKRMMKRKKDYSNYQKRVPSAIIPWPPRR